MFVFAASVEASSTSEAKTSPDFSLMLLEMKVWMRYATTQCDSTTGEAWREVLVKCHGHVRETDMGCPCGMDPSDPSGRGWWCYHDGTMKFFLKERALELDHEISTP